MMGSKKQNLTFLLILSWMCFTSLSAQSVSIQILHQSKQSAYAARKLEAALLRNGYHWETPGFLAINLDLDKALAAEAFEIRKEAQKFYIRGGDERGLIYACLAVAEKLNQGTKLEAINNWKEQPHVAFRAIKFNLPWETYRPSNALTQHTETAKDLHFWEAFFDMMVENRFNTISLWNLHPYTFMIRPKNFPLACPFTDKELGQWQKLYQGIFSLAKERGLDTYIVHWSIFVSKAFADNYHAAKKNYYPAYYVEGDTSELVKTYFRESVKQVLETYPDLDGIGISHGEGMAGMSPLQRQQWMDEVMIKGMLDANRPVKLIHRVPFSSGTSSEPGVSKNVEVITRNAMENLGDSFSGPIWAEIKFNWSHSHSTPRLEKVHGGPLGDTYFDPLPKNYQIAWQIRNEDFFALRWGVPSFIREHIQLNTDNGYASGYFVGSETYIPAKDYFTKKPGVSWKYAFERQWLFYKLWGRLLYHPEEADSNWEAAYVSKYGEKAKPLSKAMQLASQTQLRLACLYDSRWDFTLYSEGFLALQGDTTRYISVDQLIKQKTMASEYVSILDYVHARQAGQTFDPDRVTPDQLANQLKNDNQEALRLVQKIAVDQNPDLAYERGDVEIWAYLGLHLSEKIKGGIALETYRKGGGLKNKRKAIRHLKNALAYWDDVVRISTPLYLDMPLTHYNHNFFEQNDNNLFHWSKIRAEVARDVDIAKAAKVAYH